MKSLSSLRILNLTPKHISKHSDIQSKDFFQQAKHNRFHAGPPAWIERKFTFLLRLFKLKMSEYTLKIGICRN